MHDIKNIQHQVVILIPFYRETLSAYEKIALLRCEQVLAHYTRIAIKPHNLNLPPDAHIVSFNKIVSFDNAYFKNIAGYNRLLLSAEFYEHFLTYEYMLIYQLDAFVFRDDLRYWCSQEIDYLGAPWIRHKNDNWLKKGEIKLKSYLYTKLNINRKGVPSNRQFINKIGNGGFSLRRIRKFYELTLSEHEKISFYLSHTAHQYNEDAFWSIEVNRKKKILNIPGYKVGLKFAFEFAPQRALQLNHNQLPFGCHAWDKHADFWRPVFKQLGYTI
jgi:hypothetical protein